LAINDSDDHYRRHPYGSADVLKTLAYVNGGCMANEPHPNPNPPGRPDQAPPTEPPPPPQDPNNPNDPRKPPGRAEQVETPPGAPTTEVDTGVLPGKR
jgi:hypothetical protein